jgi:hypothetical protein
MTKQWDRSQTMTNQSPALVILHQAIGPVPLPSLRCWVHIPRQLPVSVEVSDMPIDILNIVKVPVDFQFVSSTCVKGMYLALDLLAYARKYMCGVTFML